MVPRARRPPLLLPWVGSSGAEQGGLAEGLPYGLQPLSFAYREKQAGIKATEQPGTPTPPESGKLLLLLTELELAPGLLQEEERRTEPLCFNTSSGVTGACSTDHLLR